MTQPDPPNTTRCTDTTNQPLLLFNDAQRRRRMKQTKDKQKTQQETTKSKSCTRTKSFITNHELVNKPKTSQKDMEENLAILYTNKQKSKSQHVMHNHKLLKPQTHRIHSKSGPPPPKRRKKRTFKLSEPTDANTHNHKKKASRNFMVQYNMTTPSRNRSKSNEAPTPTATPTATPTLTFSKSQNTLQSHKKKTSHTFKLGDDSHTLPFSSFTSSFSSYQSKFNVHKPKIKPGSNQFLVSAQMRQKQTQLKAKQAEQKLEDTEESNQYFGKSLHEIKSIKLPNYSGEIPFVLIELKKKLHCCDGLKQRKIFHISVKNNSAHHQIAHLIRSFFVKLPERLLDNFFMDILTYLQRVTDFRQIGGIISIIPDPNKSILLWLWDLLSDAIEYSESNKMSVESLSKSMAPYMCTNTNSNYRYSLISMFQFGIQWRLYLRQH